MNSAKYVDDLVARLKAEGKTKTEIVIASAEAELGWSYAWGAVGAQCNPSKRQAYANRSSCPAGESALTIKRCQVLNGSRSACDGCKWYPNGERTLIDDCQGFVKQILSRVGISMAGGGASSMWRNDANWQGKGEISSMPERLCCVFWQNPKNKSVMEHVGFYVGGGMMIHCSGEVKKEKLSKKATHWAVPKGLEGGDLPVTLPTLRRGNSGEYVTLLQTKLIQRGYDLGSYGADGKFGAKTESAVKAFQMDNGLKVDGICGKATWEALEKVTPTELYTVTIPHLAKHHAEALVKNYDGAVMTKENEG